MFASLFIPPRLGRVQFLLRSDDSLIFADEMSAGQLFDFAHRVEHALSDVLERGFDGGRGFAAHDQSIFAGRLPLDQDRFGGRRAAVRGEDGFRFYLGH